MKVRLVKDAEVKQRTPRVSVNSTNKYVRGLSLTFKEVLLCYGNVIKHYHILSLSLSH